MLCYSLPILARAITSTNSCPEIGWQWQPLACFRSSLLVIGRQVYLNLCWSLQTGSMYTCLLLLTTDGRTCPSITKQLHGHVGRKHGQHWL